MIIKMVSCRAIIFIAANIVAVMFLTTAVAHLLVANDKNYIDDESTSLSSNQVEWKDLEMTKRMTRMVKVPSDRDGEEDDQDEELLLKFVVGKEDEVKQKERKVEENIDENPALHQKVADHVHRELGNVKSSMSKGMGMMMGKGSKGEDERKTKGSKYSKSKGDYYYEKTDKCTPLPVYYYDTKGKGGKMNGMMSGKMNGIMGGKMMNKSRKLEEAFDGNEPKLRILGMMKKKSSHLFVHDVKGKSGSTSKGSSTSKGGKGKGKGKGAKKWTPSPTVYCSEAPSSVPPTCTSADIAVTGFRFRDVSSYPGIPMNNIGDGVTYIRPAFNTNAIGVECLTSGPVASTVTFDNIAPSSAQNVDNDEPYTLDNDAVDLQVFTATPFSVYGTFNWNVTCTAYCDPNGVGEASNTLSVSFLMVNNTRR
mmetsp:Transcript_20996/g.39876  ORF Transcript_20996/g.39876 Transcript_20996/m.39876 type:complete len:422 (-) Transcript_20996:53-1318(-)